MAVLPIMLTHKAFRCKYFIASAIACASVMFPRPTQERYISSSSVQPHQGGRQASAITAIDHPKGHHVMVSHIWMIISNYHT
jgi:hypothetical protein